MSKQIFFVALLLLAVMFVSAQTDSGLPDNEEGFVFTTVKENPITSVKDQNRSSTCWSFSGLGFLEAEVLRLTNGKEIVDFSEMYVVSHSMRERAELYVRLHGNATFAPGGAFSDVIYCMEHHGLVPQTAMPGIRYGEQLPVHNELDAVASGYLNALVHSDLKKLTPVWQEGFKAIYDTYLGECPADDAKLDINGRLMTPKEWTASLGLDAGNYISLTSFTHHPFYGQFAIEVEDNWRHSLSYNLPLDELMDIIRHAVNEGYTVAWASDVSELGFNRQGIAVMPDDAKGAELTGSDMARWTGMTEVDHRKELTSRPLPEMDVTQDMRQMAFDNWQTTDDHGMLIFGIAKDQNGKPYFMVKNSWGTEKSPYKGIWYASEAFVKYKTINIIIHKDALPKSIARKLGLK